MTSDSFHQMNVHIHNDLADLIDEIVSDYDADPDMVISLMMSNLHELQAFIYNVDEDDDGKCSNCGCDLSVDLEEPENAGDEWKGDAAE